MRRVRVEHLYSEEELGEPLCATGTDMDTSTYAKFLVPAELVEGVVEALVEGTMPIIEAKNVGEESFTAYLIK